MLFRIHFHAPGTFFCWACVLLLVELLTTQRGEAKKPFQKLVMLLCYLSGQVQRVPLAEYQSVEDIIK